MSPASVATANPLRVSILGAGAMGSLFGGLLAEAGHQVTLIDVATATLDAIRRDGLRVETDGGDRRVRISAVRPIEASGAPDLLIVFTKSMHTAAALSGVGHLIGDETHVLSLQNGLGNRERLCEFVPPARVLIGVTTIPADIVAPGHVRSHGAGAIRMTSADGVANAFAARVADAFNAAGLRTTIDPAVMTAIWEKVAFNAALNSVCAVGGCAVGQVAAQPDARALALAIAAETVAVANACGIAADSAAVAATVNAALDQHGAHKPSMLQDILAGRRTEIDAINGAVVAAAAKAGVPVPHTQTLLTLVRLIESRALAPAPAPASADAAREATH